MMKAYPWTSQSGYNAPMESALAPPFGLLETGLGKGGKKTTSSDKGFYRTKENSVGTNYLGWGQPVAPSILANNDLGASGPIAADGLLEEELDISDADDAYADDTGIGGVVSKVMNFVKTSDTLTPTAFLDAGAERPAPMPMWVSGLPGEPIVQARCNMLEMCAPFTLTKCCMCEDTKCKMKEKYGGGKKKYMEWLDTTLPPNFLVEVPRAVSCAEACTAGTPSNLILYNKGGALFRFGSLTEVKCFGSKPCPVCH